MTSQPPSPSATPSLTDQDRQQLAGHGISTREAERQLELLTRPPAPPRLARPCTVGDGIRPIAPEEEPALRERFHRARRAGRFVKMVPASGAASRMFKTLAPWARFAGVPGIAAKEMSRRIIAGDLAAGDLLQLITQLPRFPFAGVLAEHLAGHGQDLETLRQQGDGGALIHALLDPSGLGYGERPKGLIPFHRYPGGEARTAFEEHLQEAAELVVDGDGRCRLHLTVAEHAREAFEAHALEAQERVRAGSGRDLHFEISFSTQSPATDTLALAPDGSPFRTEDGRLLLRPGGHGALIENLAALAGTSDADLVLLKNIDNVQPDHAREETVRWKEILGGHLLALLEESHRLLDALDPQEGEPPEGEAFEALARRADAFLAEELGVRVPAAWAEGPETERRRLLVDRLDRPLRVCGMVVNRGEPGGGPYWVEAPGSDSGPGASTNLAPGTVTAQIVEKAQIDLEDPEQRRCLEGATHFNPVDLVCAVRDRRGRPRDLSAFVDPRAVFLADKSHGGEPLKALERPGLWNGAMAGWNTAFVEVPEATFTPVKTVFDLLRPAHQPSRDG